MVKVWLLLIIFLVGVGLGLAAPSVAPKYLGSYFPKSLTKPHAGVEGSVVKRQLETDRLLLTISASDGALLAIFQKKITEISLLIDEGDLVTLDLPTYAPFVNDPPILRVKKSTTSPKLSVEPAPLGPISEMTPSDPLPAPLLEDSGVPTTDVQAPVVVPDPPHEESPEP